MAETGAPCGADALVGLCCQHIRGVGPGAPDLLPGLLTHDTSTRPSQNWTQFLGRFFSSRLRFFSISSSTVAACEEFNSCNLVWAASNSSVLPSSRQTIARLNCAASSLGVSWTAF